MEDTTLNSSRGFTLPRLLPTLPPLRGGLGKLIGPLVATHQGMLPRDLGRPSIPWFKRRLPDKVFYAPVALMLIALGLRHRSLTLPTLANPSMDAGGVWGESKSQCLSILGPKARQWLAPFVTLVRPDDGGRVDSDVARAIASLRRAGIDFPVVAKPDVGYQGWGIQRLDDPAALRDYLSSYPPGRKLILQEAVLWEGEAGVFYLRRPGAARGEIYSFALTYFPHVVGNGRSTLRELIDAEPMQHKLRDIWFTRHRDRLEEVPRARETVRLAFCASARMGAVYLDARRLITPALEARFEEIARDIPDFHFGRFDIRFESMEQLLKGESFRILELNGAGAEALHIWDPNAGLLQAYRTLWQQYSLAYAIGAANAAAGHRRPEGLLRMLRRQQMQEWLRKVYPVTT